MCATRAPSASSPRSDNRYDDRTLPVSRHCLRLRRGAALDAQLPLRDLPPRNLERDDDLDLRAARSLPFHARRADLLRVVARRAARLLLELRLAAYLRERAGG